MNFSKNIILLSIVCFDLFGDTILPDTPPLGKELSLFQKNDSFKTPYYENEYLYAKVGSCIFPTPMAGLGYRWDLDKQFGKDFSVSVGTFGIDPILVIKSGIVHCNDKKEWFQGGTLDGIILLNNRSFFPNVEYFIGKELDHNQFVQVGFNAIPIALGTIVATIDPRNIGFLPISIILGTSFTYGIHF